MLETDKTLNEYSSIFDVPTILCLRIHDSRLTFDRFLTFETCERMRKTLRLTGIVYAGGNHFTSRFIDEAGAIWYHDGMSTGKQTLFESSVSDLRIGPEGRKAVFAIYSTT